MRFHSCIEQLTSEQKLRSGGFDKACQTPQRNGVERGGQTYGILQFLWVLLEEKAVLWNPVRKTKSKFFNYCKGPPRFESKGANDVKGHKLEIKGKDMFRITLIKFILISTPTNAHTHSQTHTLSGVPFTQYDMLPQHQINIRKLISECF